MRSIRILTLAGVVAAAVGLQMASANAEGMGAQSGTSATVQSGISSQAFKSLDADKSGALSETEFESFTTASVNFDQADANRDGKVTLSEARSVSGSAASNTDMSGSGGNGGVQ